jgi:multiple sugar transport system ATP-binding protein
VSRAGRVTLAGIVKRHGTFTALHGIDLEIAPGEFFALLGPSGSGKTTTLRILAGLETVNEGRVLLDGVDVTDAEPGERDVAMVFQSYALYPHMTVAENIGFPLRMVGTAKDDIARSVREAAAKVHIGHLLDRRPGQLSGGQQQRVALARAIGRKPRLSLDVTSVYVTHDQEEAMTIADRMAIFMEGRIAQIGTPDEVYARPASVDVAAFIGSPPMNLLPARVSGSSVTVAGTTITLPRDLGAARAVIFGVRPGALRLGGEGLRARVYLVEHLGDSTIVNLLIDETLVKVRTDKPPTLAEGESVSLGFDAAAIHLFDEATGSRL